MRNIAPVAGSHSVTKAPFLDLRFSVDTNVVSPSRSQNLQKKKNRGNQVFHLERRTLKEILQSRAKEERLAMRHSSVIDDPGSLLSCPLPDLQPARGRHSHLQKSQRKDLSSPPSKQQEEKRRKGKRRERRKKKEEEFRSHQVSLCVE